MIPAENYIAIPFDEGDQNDCMEVLRAWVTEHNTVALTANLDILSEEKDSAFYGVMLAHLAEEFAAAANSNFGLNAEEFLKEVTLQLKAMLNA